MNTPLNIVIIGAGNVAHHVTRSLQLNKTINITQVFNHRKTAKAKILADTNHCALVSEYAKIDTTAGIYFICVKDYAYTIQGWIKGVNSNILTSETDMGVDGGNPLLPNGITNTNHLTAKDAYGYTLGYYANDYSPIDNSKWTTPNRFEATTVGSNLITARKDLHNGNISFMATTIRDVSNYTSVNTATTVVPLPIGNAYKYDQLNRLATSTAFNNLQTTGPSANVWASTGATADMYKNSFTYDANGNISNQQKHDQNGVQFENLNYQYFDETTGGRLLKNRLYHVNDNVAYNGLQPDDIDDQGTFNYNPTNNSTLPMDYPTINTGNNYGYDEIGNLIKDVKEEIASIKWTVYGKIDSLVRISTSIKSDLKFLYDAGGNRIAKIEKTKTSTGALNPTPFWKTTYYVRDAQGNVMATYKSTTPIPTSGGTPPLTFKLTERDIYGSSRLGLDNNEIEFIGSSGIDLTQAQRILGKKQYELKNHLDNVIAVVSDRKIAVDNNNDLITDYYLADVVNATDYTPFGAPLVGRTFSSSSYRYGFNGKEKVDEVTGQSGRDYDFGDRVYDADLGRWWSIDPLQTKYPALSPYNFVGNSPIRFIDPDGKEIVDSKGHAVNVKFDDKGKVSTSETEFAKGTSQKVKDAFFKNSAPVLEVLNSTSVGKKNLDYLIQIPTKVKVDPTAKVKKENQNALSTVDRGGDVVGKDGKTYYETATIVPDIPLIEASAKKSNSDVDEVMGSVMTVETTHLKPENKTVDNSPTSTFADKYQEALNSAVDSRLDYRKTKGQPVTKEVFGPVENNKDKGVKLNDANQKIKDNLK